MDILVTPQDVSAAYPDAPEVTANNVQEAKDWAEALLEKAQVTLAPDSRQERSAKRAVMCYALHLRSFVMATGTRTSTTTATGALKTIDIDGEIKIERAALSGDKVASQQATASDDWLSRAWAALYGAGLPWSGLARGDSA